MANYFLEWSLLLTSRCNESSLPTLQPVWQFSFDLSKPISIKEAIFALDYIDHDFYVFRDEETNEVSVVYKRNAGGVGLIQPEQ